MHNNNNKYNNNKNDKYVIHIQFHCHTMLLLGNKHIYAIAFNIV